MINDVAFQCLSNCFWIVNWQVCCRTERVQKMDRGIFKCPQNVKKCHVFFCVIFALFPCWAVASWNLLAHTRPVILNTYWSNNKLMVFPSKLVDVFELDYLFIYFLAVFKIITPKLMPVFCLLFHTTSLSPLAWRLSAVDANWRDQIYDQDMWMTVAKE